MKTAQYHLNKLGLIDGNGEVHSYPDEIIPAMEAYADQFKPQWIPVSERLPEVDESDKFNSEHKISIQVLTYSHFGIIKGKYYYAIDEWIIDGVHSSDGIEVTHWMPMPQQPEE